VVSEEEGRIYVHVYYNGIRAEEEKAWFSKTLALAETVLRSGGKLNKTQTTLCERYFIVKDTPSVELQ
jgi:hypothetical protein